MMNRAPGESLEGFNGTTEELEYHLFPEWAVVAISEPGVWQIPDHFGSSEWVRHVTVFEVETSNGRAVCFRGEIIDPAWLPTQPTYYLKQMGAWHRWDITGRHRS